MGLEETSSSCQMNRPLLLCITGSLISMVFLWGCGCIIITMKLYLIGLNCAALYLPLQS